MHGALLWAPASNRSRLRLSVATSPLRYDCGVVWVWRARWEPVRPRDAAMRFPREDLRSNSHAACVASARIGS